MCSRDLNEDPLIAESEYDHMDDTFVPGSILDDTVSNPDITEQVHTGDEGEGDMDTSQVEPEVVKEAISLQPKEIVPVDQKGGQHS